MYVTTPMRSVMKTSVNVELDIDRKEPPAVTTFILFNPLKCSGVRQLHLKVFSAIQVQPTFLISDIRVLWRSGLSARVPECQTLKM